MSVTIGPFFVGVRLVEIMQATLCEGMFDELNVGRVLIVWIDSVGQGKVK